MNKSIFTFAAVALLTLPAAAQQRTDQPIPVVDAGPGSIAVINKWSSRDDDLWCAAAKGALSRGAGWKDRLYVVGVSGAPETITFTFRPTQEQLAQPRTGRSSVRGVGNSLTLSSANRRCTREPDFL
ncbi:hypothetical protein shim_13940 [Shimia sp. SK013]|uniref:hypothetical protein n=1 Tax=Shimia sp. SK013 TaxID=1389006 RepID=UPI0006CDB90C|nr:hypothetical protein [Shimia sp. SK013]KPA23100.1 hypothetical protein shim_13940 [Shimia sp. SK013]